MAKSEVDALAVRLDPAIALGTQVVDEPVGAPQASAADVQQQRIAVEAERHEGVELFLPRGREAVERHAEEPHLGRHRRGASGELFGGTGGCAQHTARLASGSSSPSTTGPAASHAVAARCPAVRMASSTWRSKYRYEPALKHALRAGRTAS